MRKKQINSILLAITLFLLFQRCARVQHEQEGYAIWPGEAWAVSNPEAEGIDGAAIDSIHSDITKGKYGLIDEFLVIRHGKIVADHHYTQNYDSIAAHYDTTNHMFNYDHPKWHPYYQGSMLHSLQSVTKSITAIALGIVIDEGRLAGVDIHPLELFTDYAQDFSDPRRKAMTLEDMLTMRSGIDWDEGSYESDDNSCIIMEKSDAWVQYVLSRPMREAPGSLWNYNSGVSVLLGKLIGLSTGMRVDAWTEEKLFKPLGIRNYFWKTTPDGEVDTEGGLYLSSKDLARIGYLFLHNGRWGDQQVVPESWVEKSIKPTVVDINPLNDSPDSGYGYQWWVPSTAPLIFAGRGYGGQFVMVAPLYDLVVVFNGWNIHYNDYPLSSFAALQDRIMPVTKIDNN
ncbi:MAG: beta-lactamase family protein [Cyclobacteriaceae bacterium]|nr:beta-lactamase family protein [Cyclobacteriaceae bacterium]MDH4295463.1 beta-lactamase family protein [Cyclobacteriaceae bacterium]MDH5249525.1 beta-lactamase family protein [Cyclobacteriaceae bacterium]